ncbi:SURF1 family cytochrome oxidase biogenesis protein [Nocardia bovistercoris]|uniref:SURF1-like protein n=1 Tax=Nocardia bovistercoris TaxID=2785916 RepID=A0A931IE25_9NOCA|nr:SURF1 family cytochrome oxidase biogenesis protein [Nocardia bovistercoris]MBH0779967.1 SURF1 family protein [Nocardia bovistercoris]
MRRFGFLLRPSWFILAGVVIAFAYLCFTVLAPWQLGKNTSTSHRNQAIADSVRADPVDITSVIEGSGTDTEWRRVTADGAFVPESTLLVRLRHLDGAPGYAVLAAFKTTDGRILLVDRGLVAAVAGSTRPPAIADPPAGPQHIEGRVRVSEGVVPDRAPLTEDGFRQVYSIDTTQAMTVIGLPLTTIPAGDRGGYLQLSENQPGAFTPTPLPQLDAGPYLSYGLQWLAFGIMAPLGLGYFVWAEIRERRKDKAATDGPAPTPRQTPQNRLADRYGRDRT